MITKITHFFSVSRLSLKIASQALTLLFLATDFVKGQDIQFNHITTDDGLSSGNVRCIAEDYQGFIWIATEDGLHRYDGYDLIIYRHDDDNPESISGNFVMYVYEDSYKNLWIGTLDGGLSLYDREKDTFKNFKHIDGDPTSLHNNAIRAIVESPDKTLYIGTGGISYFKLTDPLPEKIIFDNIKPSGASENDEKSKWINTLISDKQGNILAGSNGGGLLKFNPRDKSLIKLLDGEEFDQIEQLFIDSKDRLWIGTWDSGLYIFDKHLQKYIHYKADNKENTLFHNQIEHIKEDNEGNFWIGTDKGLSMMTHDQDPLEGAEFITFLHNDFDPGSLLTDAIKALFIDSKGRCWIGSYFGGVNFYDKYDKKFIPIRKKVWKPESSLSHNNVTAFTADNKGNLWIGTDGGGLNLLPDADKNLFTDRYIQLYTNLSGLQKIKTLETDRAGNIWAGTWGDGMYKINPLTKSIIHYDLTKSNGESFSSQEVICIKADKENNIWFGTFSSGIYHYNTKTNVYTHFPKKREDRSLEKFDRINTLYIDNQDRVWVGKEIAGLNLYDLNSKSFKAIESDVLSKELTVNTICQDSHEIIWVGSIKGLIRFDPETNGSKLYNSKYGLANDIIYSIREDEEGNLWLGTNYGLSKFDPENESFLNFNKADGLQGSQFNLNSAYTCPDGRLLFGGINGFNAFYPDQIRLKKDEPEIVFTRFWLNNKEVRVNSPKSPLEKNIIVADKIELKYNQNSFSVEFAALDYDFSPGNIYSYKLEGFDEEWHEIGNERKVVFTKIRPGEYELKVKVTNSDGFWISEEQTLPINIKAAWWQTVWFYLGVFSLIPIFGFLIFRVRLRYLVKQKKTLEKQVKNRTLELENKNYELAEKVREIGTQNITLHKQKLEIANQNNEIQAQNEELFSQNDQINLQRTELEKTQEKLKRINEKLEQLVDERTKKLKKTIKKLDKTVLELDRFVYSASHDLSAPLKSILGLVKIARLENDPDRIRECHDHIETSINRLDLVINSLVEYSRNIHQEINISDFHLYNVIKETYEELSFMPNANKINFEIKVDKDVIASTDRQRLKIILQNTIGNSIKYADLKKPESEVIVLYNSGKEYWSISIVDNGLGIRKEYLKKVYNMYYRASEISEGSGLGLFITKETVRKLKGRINLKSKEGLGTECKIEIPY